MSFNNCSYNQSSYNQGCQAMDTFTQGDRAWPSGNIATLATRDNAFLNSMERNAKSRQIQQLLNLRGIDSDGDIGQDILDIPKKPDEYVTITITFDSQVHRFDAVIPGNEPEITIDLQDLEDINTDTISFNITDLKVH